jgi:hypothetical protein
LNESKWIFERNVMVYPINCFQMFMYNQLTPISNIFLVKDDLLCYCSVLPTTIGCSWIMFEGYLDFTLKHPSTLGEVLRLGCVSDSLALIHKGCFYSYSRWNKVTKANIPLDYDIKNKIKMFQINISFETW